MPLCPAGKQTNPSISAIVVAMILLAQQAALAQGPSELERIVVKVKTDNFGTEGSNSIDRETIGARVIGDWGASAGLAPLLKRSGAVDLRQRSGFGIQADLSLRGSTYEQVAVAIEGINLNDPQTGHHNLDLPLTSFDVEKVTLVKQGNTSFYGSGALVGSVDFALKRPQKKAFSAAAEYGQNALFGQTFSLSLPQKNWAARLSVEHRLAKAARPNTDFEYATSTLYLNRDFSAGSADLVFGYQEKDFGADSFYSNLFPEEEEHTRTWFWKAGWQADSYKGSLYLRRHHDKFILRRNNPTSVNYHTTYKYGLNARKEVDYSLGQLLFMLDCGNEEINSTNLGKHSRLFNAFSAGFSLTADKKIEAGLNCRLDYLEGWQTQYSYNLQAGYKLAPQLKIKGDVSRSLRLPTFTELYYSDSGNKGNSQLKAEQSDNFSGGAEFSASSFNVSLAGFLRRGRNLIDWTRASASEIWQATNLGRVDFSGLEVALRWQPKPQLGWLRAEDLSLAYLYMERDRKSSGFLSKYALDILKHKCAFNAGFIVWGVNFSWQLAYCQRYYGEGYFLADLYLARRINAGAVIWEPFFRVDNLANTSYSEVGGVPQPRRWLRGGLRMEW
jgi:iron complex outermembrane receptor protein